MITRLEAAQARAQLYDLIRFRLSASGHLEVETPAMVSMPGMEPHITAFESEYRPELGTTPARRLYLHTSPEYAMKRLLSDGFGSVFQICKVFRNGEVAQAHNPEFTMLEFYRSPGTVEELMDDLEEIVRRAGAQLSCRTPGLSLDGPFERLTVREAFRRHAGQEPPADEDAFFKLMLDRVEPKLGRERPTFLTEYPASMASLARLKPGDASVSERFELYAGGAELANGFGELNDAAEQRRRLIAEQEQRRAAGRAVYPLDERFLEAVGRMPPSAGVAVGLDRLLMVLLGTERIADVLLFPAEAEWA
jgi:lysyl-tRNA synthetase class 2